MHAQSNVPFYLHAMVYKRATALYPLAPCRGVTVCASRGGVATKHSVRGAVKQHRARSGVYYPSWVTVMKTMGKIFVETGHSL